jgi:galactose-1-phosphate uridylyltransferase
VNYEYVYTAEDKSLVMCGPGKAPTLDRRETENSVAYFMSMFMIFSKDPWKPGPNSSFYLSCLIENQIEKYSKASGYVLGVIVMRSLHSARSHENEGTKCMEMLIRHWKRYARPGDLDLGIESARVPNQNLATYQK